MGDLDRGVLLSAYPLRAQGYSAQAIACELRKISVSGEPNSRELQVLEGFV